MSPPAIAVALGAIATSTSSYRPMPHLSNSANGETPETNAGPRTGHGSGVGLRLVELRPRGSVAWLHT